MNISMQLAVVVAAACLCLVDGAPDGRLVRTKQQRPTRGFKNVEMMTARGFGKRDRPATRAEQPYEYLAPTRRKFHPKAKLMVAPDFGKRSDNDENIEEEPYQYLAPMRRKFHLKAKLMVAPDFGKRSDNDENIEEVYGLDSFWDTLETSPEREGQDITTEDKKTESIPLDWFVNEMLNNPDFTRSVVRKFIDLNQDGVLSSEELLRNAV